MLDYKEHRLLCVVRERGVSMSISHGVFNRVVGLFDLQFKRMNRAGRGKFTHPLFIYVEP